MSSLRHAQKYKDRPQRQADPAADRLRHGNLELTLIAYGHDGNSLNWMVRSMDFSLSPVRYEAFLKVGQQLHFDIDAPKNTRHLRSGIYDVASGRAGTPEIPLGEVDSAFAIPSSGRATPAKPN